MNGKIKAVHRILLTVSILILGASLVFYLIKWGDYPEEIGVHFGPDGGFDVTASKFFGFYPHVIGGIVIAGIAFACRLIGKKKTGLRISEKGEEHFRGELCLTLDCIALLVSLFFAYWSVCVALQQPLDTDKGLLALGLIAAASAAGIIAETVTYIRHREKAGKAAPSGLSHRLCRLIPWLLTAGAAAALAECWERYPADEKLFGDPAYFGKVYSANFNAYYDRKLLLIALIAVLILLTVRVHAFISAVGKAVPAVKIASVRHFQQNAAGPALVFPTDSAVIRTVYPGLFGERLCPQQPLFKIQFSAPYQDLKGAVLRTALF